MCDKEGQRSKDADRVSHATRFRPLLNHDNKTEFNPFLYSRQRKLEEALLYSGQFKDAMSALLDWLKKQQKQLAADSPVHGDLDTVMALIEQHKVCIREDIF